MTRRLLLTAALAACFALPSAAATPRAQQFPGVYREIGVYTVRYGVANGYDGREVSAEEYAAFVKDGSCQPNSHVSVWRSKLVTLVCEL